MADKQDKNVTGQKRHSKGRGKKAQRDVKTHDEKGDCLGEKESVCETVCVADKLVASSDKQSELSSKTGVETERNQTEAGGSGFVLKENEVNMEQMNVEKNKKSEKTREEILAEREAKKLAKQAMKKKAKEGNVDKENKQKQGIPNESKQDEVLQKGKENSESKEKILRQSEDNKCDIVKTDGETIKDAKIEGVECVDGKSETKTKAQLRAERRAKQEAQRAKKLEKTKAVYEEKIAPVLDVPKPVKPIVKEVKVPQPSQEKVHKVKLFAHLYRELYDCVEMSSSEDIHPSIKRLGTQYRSKVISGATARCLALLNAFKTVIKDYKTPPNQELSRGLEGEISKSMAFLNKCRPVAVSMVNAVKHLKFQVNQISGNESDWKEQLRDWIDTYIKDQIEKAAEAISLFVLQKITDGDVILTYSCSSLIQRALIKAKEAKIRFRVIVVDGRPWLEGKEMLRRLVKAGISCTYVLFNGLSFIMPEVTKVVLGAHALLANGYVMSRAGSSQIALLAKTYNVPVLVCCETHKFSEKVQTDSFVHNELGDPDQLICKVGSGSKELSKWRTMQYLTPLNLTYDVTPPDLVTAVVTEIAVLPCTSVPVILRVKPQDLT